MPEIPVDPAFRARYRDLEGRMKTRAEADGDVFLPNPEPTRPVDHLFVCMEPSLGRWVNRPDQLRARVEAGSRNFVNSLEDFLLHFSIRRFLCGAEDLYHITDVSKGAMLVEQAGIARTERYDRWHALLMEEIDLVAKPTASLFAVGKAVVDHLTKRRIPGPFQKVLHYSGQAAQARSTGILGHEDAFEVFKETVSLEDVLDVAHNVLDTSVPSRFRDETLAQLAGRKLTESRKKLIFNYKLTFEAHSN